MKEYLDLFLSLDSSSPEEILKKVYCFFVKFFFVEVIGLILCKEDKIKQIILPEEYYVDQSPNSDILIQLKNRDQPYIHPVNKNFTFLSKLEEKSNLTNLLLLPLKEGDEFLGVLFLYMPDSFQLNKNNRRKFCFIAKYISLIIKNKYYYDKMEQRLAELLTLQNVSDFVNSTLDFKKLLDITLDAIVGLIGLRSCSITIFTDKLFNDIFTREQNALVNTVNMSKEIKINMDMGIYRDLSKNRSPISRTKVADDELLELIPSNHIKKGEKIKYIILPVTRGEQLYGSINLFDPTLVHLENIESHFLESFANQFSIALQNANLYRKQSEMANKDGLTTLYNHAYFQNMMDRVLSEESLFPISLIFIDIDDFKLINDQYGHLTGDKVLKELSAIMLQNTRKGDITARYGGEEFAILLPGTDEDQAYLIAERIRKEIGSKIIIINNNKELQVTVSMGVAGYKQEWTKKLYINKVDELLYIAKNNGKNRVEREI